MSGAKRKSGYRKGVTNTYDCEDDPELGENDVIAKVFSLVFLLSFTILLINSFRAYFLYVGNI